MAFHKMEGELSSCHPHAGHKSCPCCCWLHACGPGCWHPMQQLVPVALEGKEAGAGVEGVWGWQDYSHTPAAARLQRYAREGSGGTRHRSLCSWALNLERGIGSFLLVPTYLCQ